VNPLSIAPWAIAAVLAAGGFAYVIHCQNNAKFKDEAIRMAEAQIKEVEKIAARNLKAKEDADAQRTKERASLERTIKRLRDSAGPSLVPATASCSGSTTVAAFDRAELDRALRNFTEGVQELVGEGQQAVIDLDSAKGWASKLSMSISSVSLALLSEHGGLGRGVFDEAAVTQSDEARAVDAHALVALPQVDPEVHHAAAELHRPAVSHAGQHLLVR